MDLLKTLNENSGAVTAAATAVYAVVTTLLLLEARAARIAGRAANVEAWPVPYGSAALFVAIRLENYGPAGASDVELVLTFSQLGQVIPASRRKHAEPRLPTGWHRTFLLGVPDASGRVQQLEDLANKETIVRAVWTWRDRRGQTGRNAKQSRELEFDLREYRDGLYGGAALAESDQAADLHAIREELHLLVGEARSGNFREQRRDMSRASRLRRPPPWTRARTTLSRLADRLRRGSPTA